MKEVINISPNNSEMKKFETQVHENEKTKI
jgi:hypothetical protein